MAGWQISWRQMKKKILKTWATIQKHTLGPVHRGNRDLSLDTQLLDGFDHGFCTAAGSYHNTFVCGQRLQYHCEYTGASE